MQLTFRWFGPGDPVLLASFIIRTFMLIGIVFLMTTKPSLAGSLIVMLVALALGLASGLLVSRVTRTRWQNVAAQENRVREPL